MPMHHHRHDNKKDKRNEAIMRHAQETMRVVAVQDNPMPYLTLGIDNVNAAIREITGTFEDTFQQVWVTIIERRNEIQTLDDIRNIAKEVSHNEASATIGKIYKELSLDKPIARSPDKDNEYTLLDTIESPEIKPDLPEIEYKRKQSINGHIRLDLDAEAASVLKKKYPGLAGKQAIRKLLGLSVNTTHWRPEELEILKQGYENQRATHAIANELGRSHESVRNKIADLKLHRERIRFTPEGYFNCEDVLKIFQFSAKHLREIRSIRHLNFKLIGKALIVSLQDLQSFVEKYPFEYRHDLISSDVRLFSHVPTWVKEWVTVIDASKKLHITSGHLLELIRQNRLQTKIYSNTVHYVRVADVQYYLNLPVMQKQPYQVGYCWQNSISHYVFQNKEGDWIKVCSPNSSPLVQKTHIDLGYMKIHFAPGYPTCKVCMSMLKNREK